MRVKKFLSLTAILFSLIVNAQVNRFIGTWNGSLDVGNGSELRVVFHIMQNADGSLRSTADSPDQSAYGFKCDSTGIDKLNIYISMKVLNASFTGTLRDDSTIQGTFVQQIDLPLTLKKGVASSETPVATAPAFKRPQTPQPPFPYISEDILYSNSTNSLQYGATITIPEGKGTFPAVILITGSGPQDRDETILGHKPFAIIADHLTRKGYIVLRVDDRGIGKSTGNFSTATSADFAEDVKAGIDYLLSRKEVDKKKIGLLGHSEGGMIAPLVATQRDDIKFLILLAAPGVKVIDLMVEQNAAIAQSAGISEATVKEIKPLLKKVMTAIVQAPDTSTAIKDVTKITEEWSSTASPAMLAEMNFTTPALRTAYITEMVREFQSPWFKYFMSFDPVPYLEKLKGSVLALNGDKDVQVVASQNIPGIEAALKKTKTDHEIKILPGLNHLFQNCTKCTVEEYAELEETISPAVLDIISTWMSQHVGKR